MKKSVFILAIVSVLFVFTSCEDFLDTKNYTAKDDSSFPRTEEDAFQLVNGVYYSMLQAITRSNYVVYSYFFTSELSADYRLGGGGIADRNVRAITHQQYTFSDMHNYTWETHYNGIARANAALKALEGMEDGVAKSQKMGEMKVLRAHFYFELVQMLGDVPLMRAAPENVEEAKVAPLQATQEEIYQFLTKDLWDAYNDMPDVKWNDYPSGTITKWAAAGILARAFLFYTGFYNKESLPVEGGGQVTREQVAAALKNCIDNSGHSLVPDYRSLWAYSNSITKRDYPYAVNATEWVRDGLNPEHVYVCKMISGTANFCNDYALYMSLRRGARVTYETIFPIGQGWGFGPVNPRLWDEWAADEPDDLRRQASIWHHEHETVYDITTRDEVPATYEWAQDGMVENTGLWQKKVIGIRAYGKNGNNNVLWNGFMSAPEYFNITADNFQRATGTDFIFVRFADIHLMHSEITRTADGINTVRARVNLPPVAGYSDDALRKERLHELAFEGHRWMDIRRWHIAEEVLDNKYGVTIFNEDHFTTMKPQGARVSDRYRATKGFFMIPITQITLSEGAIKQNPGWDGVDAVYDTFVD